MTGTRPAEILRQLEQPGEPDPVLLARFAATKDADAFAELVRRHGPLVFGVCRRVTGHPQDAEDAFQATFLVLTKKVGAIRNPALLGNWLYGVAFRVAWKARRAAARRRAREVAVSILPDVPAPVAAPAMAELVPILDEELAALAACYRDAIVMCDLRGFSRAEAATALGIPEGTLSSRLSNGRKKLAARLAKRGVALPAAMLPAALCEATASAAVPNELVTKTCSLVAEFAAGGPVPHPLARLAEGGITMRKTLMLGALLAFAVGGVVLAARSNEDAPPSEPVKPPVVTAEKPEAIPQPKDAPKPDPKGGEKRLAPRMRSAVDVRVAWVKKIVWSPDGNQLAVQGASREGQKTVEEIRVGPVRLDKRWEPSRREVKELGPLVGFSADSRVVVCEVREYHLASGFHQLRFWNVPDPDPFALHSRVVDLDSSESRGYAFARDGKTYRTVRIERTVSGEATRLEVVERELESGNELKSLLKLDYGHHALSSDGTRLAVLSKDLMKVTVYDVSRGAKLFDYAVKGGKDLPRLSTYSEDWTYDPPLSSFGNDYPQPVPSLVFSPNGKRLLFARGVDQTIVLNAETGDALPTPEGLRGAGIYPNQHAFSNNGRLLVAPGRSYEQITRVTKPEGDDKGRVKTIWEAKGRFLTVWDTETGKIVKSWPRCEATAAFNPARPILAMFEANGEDVTRVGFWDFSAEAEKK